MIAVSLEGVPTSDLFEDAVRKFSSCMQCDCRRDVFDLVTEMQCVAAGGVEKAEAPEGSPGPPVCIAVPAEVWTSMDVARDPLVVVEALDALLRVAASGSVADMAVLHFVLLFQLLDFLGFALLGHALETFTGDPTTPWWAYARLLRSADVTHSPGSLLQRWCRPFAGRDDSKPRLWVPFSWLTPTLRGFLMANDLGLAVWTGLPLSAVEVLGPEGVALLRHSGPDESAQPAERGDGPADVGWWEKGDPEMFKVHWACAPPYALPAGVVCATGIVVREKCRALMAGPRAATPRIVPGVDRLVVLSQGPVTPTLLRHMRLLGGPDTPWGLRAAVLGSGPGWVCVLPPGGVMGVDVRCAPLAVEPWRVCVGLSSSVFVSLPTGVQCTVAALHSWVTGDVSAEVRALVQGGFISREDVARVRAEAETTRGYRLDADIPRGLPCDITDDLMEWAVASAVVARLEASRAYVRALATHPVPVSLTLRAASVLPVPLPPTICEDLPLAERVRQRMLVPALRLPLCGKWQFRALRVKGPDAEGADDGSLPLTRAVLTMGSVVLTSRPGPAGDVGLASTHPHDVSRYLCNVKHHLRLMNMQHCGGSLSSSIVQVVTPQALYDQVKAKLPAVPMRTPGNDQVFVHSFRALVRWSSYITDGAAVFPVADSVDVLGLTVHMGPGGAVAAL